jgi:hypothetical protein
MDGEEEHMAEVHKSEKITINVAPRAVKAALAPRTTT